MLRLGGTSGEWLQAQESEDAGLQFGGLGVLREGSARRIGLDPATVAAECAKFLQKGIEAVRRRDGRADSVHPPAQRQPGGCV